MSKFKNKVVVITGVSNAIGLSTARLFIKDGARVVVTGNDLKVLKLAVTELGNRAVAICGDVAKNDDLNCLCTQIYKQFGRVNLLFASAGNIPFVPFEIRNTTHE